MKGQQQPNPRRKEQNKSTKDFIFFFSPSCSTKSKIITNIKTMKTHQIKDDEAQKQ